MINLFWSIPQRFFHNAIAWPELVFTFNILPKEVTLKDATSSLKVCDEEEQGIRGGSSTW